MRHGRWSDSRGGGDKRDARIKKMEVLTIPYLLRFAKKDKRKQNALKEAIWG